MLIGCITGPDFGSAKRQIEIANRICDGIEIRVDKVSTSDLRQLMNLCTGVCILTDSEGDETLLELEPDYLTLPWDYPKEISSSKTKIIRAYHNFSETPKNLEAILEAMPKADFYKIATMAQKTTDAMRMLCFVKEKRNISGICMGLRGEITRVLGPVVGNDFDFAKIEEEIAPGQLSASELIKTYHYPSLSPSTSLYGLVGYPLTKNRSHIIHNTYFQKHQIDAVYVRLPLEEDELPLFFSLARKLEMRGLSVTRPHKEKIFPFIDSCEMQAKEIGAINTLTFSNGKISGANTDAEGALDALEEKVVVKDKHCVILGAGGAAKAIGYEAKKRGANLTILSRRKEQAKALAEKLEASFGILDDLGSYEILINTTPNPMPVPITSLLPNTVVMEITPANSYSPFMERAQEIGCECIFGETMFEKQKWGQYSRWGITPSVS